MRDSCNTGEDWLREVCVGDMVDKQPRENLSHFPLHFYILSACNHKVVCDNNRSCR